MVRAVVDGVVIAESAETQKVEGNHYFPPNSIKKEYFSEPTATHTTCHWKGEASYYNVQVGGKTIVDGAWFYPNPKDAAKHIKDHVAFYKSKGIQIQE